MKNDQEGLAGVLSTRGQLGGIFSPLIHETPANKHANIKGKAWPPNMLLQSSNYFISTNITRERTKIKLQK